MELDRLIEILGKRAERLAELREHDFPEGVSLTPGMMLLEENLKGCESGIHYVASLLGRMKALAEEPELEPHGEHGDLMTLAEWIEDCESGYFIDYDGYGRIATEDGRTSIEISPSERTYFDFPAWATHIAWYNR